MNYLIIKIGLCDNFANIYLKFSVPESTLLFRFTHKLMYLWFRFCNAKKAHYQILFSFFKMSFCRSGYTS